MDIETSKENICINRLITQKKEIFFASDDMIVPDSKPDILSIINAKGNICINKKEITNDKIKLEGNINTYIMYLPDSKEDYLRSLNFNINISENIVVPEAKEGMLVKTKYEIKDIECKVINGRKIKLKATIEVIIKLYSNEDVNIIKEVNNVKDIQILQKKFNIESLIGNGKTTVYAKDTINIDTQDEFAEILKLDINIINKDIKVSYNKVLTKAEAEIKIIYLTEDNRISKTIGMIPIVGFIDIQNISEENVFDISYETKNILVKANPTEEHSIYIELEIIPMCMVYEKKEISMIQDLYSPTLNLECSKRNILANSDNSEFSNNFIIKDKVEVQGLNEDNLIDIDAKVNLINTNISDSKIEYTGEILLKFIFLTEKTVNTRSEKIPFEISTDNTFNSKNIRIDTEFMVKTPEISLNGGSSVDIKADMEVNSIIYVDTNMSIIENIKCLEIRNINEDYDSIILYIVKSGDTLWNIAKRFNSTVEELCKVNEIEDENKIMIGQKIYIPKFNYIKKENINNERQQIIV